MTDRFKFRHWDKQLNRMRYADIQLDYAGKPFILRAESEGLKVEDIDDVITMQCTGLKDKNGKLIYEGDIVNVYVSPKKLYRYQVKFEIGSFMLVSNDEIFDFPNKWNDNAYPLSQLYFEYENEENCIYQLEAIGNIYENPELLKEVQ